MSMLAIGSDKPTVAQAQEIITREAAKQSGAALIPIINAGIVLLVHGYTTGDFEKAKLIPDAMKQFAMKTVAMNAFGTGKVSDVIPVAFNKGRTGFKGNLVTSVRAELAVVPEGQDYPKGVVNFITRMEKLVAKDSETKSTEEKPVDAEKVLTNAILKAMVKGGVNEATVLTFVKAAVLKAKAEIAKAKLAEAV